MSTRQIRKLLGSNSLPPLEGDSDEDFEPLYSKAKAKPLSSYDGLEFSCGSNSDDNAAQSVEEVADDGEIGKKQKKKKKKRKKTQKPKSATADDELDEVDRSVLEVNALLGSPPPAAPSTSQKQADPAEKLLSVHSKHLNYRNEIKKMFGTENPEEIGNAKRHRTHNVNNYKKPMIVQMQDNIQFQRNGLSMSLLRKENGCSYFVFDHSRDYQIMHKAYLESENSPESIHLQLYINENRVNVHVEALLHITDQLFRSEEYTAANKILEYIISYMQDVAHPLFNLTNRHVRLEYKYAENRPFFLAVLKYLHMLTNKACHRTALELAKLLLNLDPSDPLGIIYIIDVLALRAREHQWLVDVIDYWSTERHAHYLFNLKYSNALAHFHITKKSKGNDYSVADDLLKQAILAFPTITAEILKAAKHDESAHILKHPMLNNLNEDKYKIPENVYITMVMHAKLVYSKWREPVVMTWFLRNVNELIHLFDTDRSVKKKVEDLIIQRASLFAEVPREILRHLFTIGPMTSLLVERDPPQINQPRRAWNPLPPVDDVARYQYSGSDMQTMLLELFPYLATLNRMRRAPEDRQGDEERQPADRH